MNEENKPSAWLPIMIIAGVLFWVAVVIFAVYANGLNNLEKNKKIEELQKYKCSWEEFNRTHIPGTALPRLPEIEAIYNDQN